MADMRGKTCCFTGHRDIGTFEKIKIVRRAETIIRELYSKGVRYFGVGGAIGFDTIMAQLLFKLRQDGMSDIKVILVYPFNGFTSRWTETQQKTYQQLLPQYNKVVCVSEQAGKEAYLARVRHLVDGSSYCVAYCTRDTGGTAYTLRYAEKQGLTIYNIAQRK